MYCIPQKNFVPTVPKRTVNYLKQLLKNTKKFKKL